MKIGFSSLVCPGWDFGTIVAKAREYGYDGVELRGIMGEMDLTIVPEVAADPVATRQRFADAKIELVCIGASGSFDSPDRKTVAAHRLKVIEFIELAGQLGCPLVRVFIGEIPKGDNRYNTLARIALTLQTLAPIAAKHRVTILVENSAGDFAGSRDLWYVVDYAAHPAIRCCWNPFNAMTLCERPTTSIPRLGNKIGMVHVCDGTFDPQGLLIDYKVPGTGEVELARMIELLKGIVYRGYLVFEWPKLWVDRLAAPEQVLPQVAKFLKERVNAKEPVLSAYKGDKNAPKFAVPLPLPVPR
jgi:sugar phosphate isomerase/epimerase